MTTTNLPDAKHDRVCLSCGRSNHWARVRCDCGADLRVYSQTRAPNALPARSTVHALPLLNECISLVFRNGAALGSLATALGLVNWAFWWVLLGKLSTLSLSDLFSVPGILSTLFYFEAFRIGSHHVLYHTRHGRKVAITELANFVRRTHKQSRHQWVVLGVALAEDAIVMLPVLVAMTAARVPELQMVIQGVLGLLIFPVALRLPLALPLACVCPMGVRACFARAAELTHGHGWVIFRIYMVMGIVWVGSVAVFGSLLALLIDPTAVTFAITMQVFGCAIGSVFSVVPAVLLYDLLPTHRDPNTVRLELAERTTSEFSEIDVTELSRSRSGTELEISVQVGNDSTHRPLGSLGYGTGWLQISADGVTSILNVSMEVVEERHNQVRIGLVHRDFGDVFSRLFCPSVGTWVDNSVRQTDIITRAAWRYLEALAFIVLAIITLTGGARTQSRWSSCAEGVETVERFREAGFSTYSEVEAQRWGCRWILVGGTLAYGVTGISAWFVLRKVLGERAKK